MERDGNGDGDGTRDAERRDGRDTRWNDHRAERRDRVLDAALAAIAREGSGVSVAAIGKEAGMPRSVVYRVFRSREDLDEQIRARIMDDLMSELAPTLDPKGTVREAVRLVAATYVGWVVEHPRLHQFLGTGSRVVVGTRTAVARQLAGLLDEFAVRLLAGAQAPTGYSLDLAFGMVGLVDGVVNRWVAHPESRSTPEDLTAFLSDALWGVLSGAARQLGVELDPDLPIDDLR
ncbi:TetR/AcrR family transcriptional regulator [Streptomyces cavernicola]|uniref:TetR/AcrR family transcriptional regulator n=1 Tax=Streptomyces cavernicola TaxID=3043613 RepID=A0ABT6SKG5_9ACTN|nr:TetR/AcrR family transcriptional regulator [Streptomyces sp. B-S-A6]MDI3408142.1 TetR/AcrR family transcriptional regulator [Streptomyces sp. B-S-A6]